MYGEEKSDSLVRRGKASEPTEGADRGARSGRETKRPHMRRTQSRESIWRSRVREAAKQQKTVYGIIPPADGGER